MAFKKFYFPVDAVQQAVENKQDFDMWYDDGELFMHVTSDWESEKSQVKMFSHTGGESIRIKPDNKALHYDVRVERYTYMMKTHTIFEHYFIEGMLWQMHGSPSNGHCNFENENTGKKDMLLTTVKLPDKGKCYEVKVKDVSKLRPAAGAIIAILIKEQWKGLSCGEPYPDGTKWYKRLKRYFLEPGYSYEDIQSNPELTK